MKVGTWGTFDYIIHAGHLALLGEAKKLGEHLCVFVVSDDTVVRSKNRFPFYPAEQRANNLLSTGLVDNVVILKSDDYIYNVENQVIPIGLDRYIFGRDQDSVADSYLRKRLSDIGVEIFTSEQPEIIHTSNLLSAIGYTIAAECLREDGE